MIAKLQSRPRWQRYIIFGLLVVLVIAFFLSLTIVVLVQTARSTPRLTAIAILDDRVAVREFAVLPDADSYPASLALRPDGTLLTGSYASGTLWAISPEGAVREIPQTRENIGSISGLDVGLDGYVYILDRLDPLRVSGAIVWRLTPEEILEPWLELTRDDSQGVLLPDDIVVDGAGNVYVSDRGLNRIWKFTPDGEGVIWWTSPPVADARFYAPTGLAYDVREDTLIISDSALNILYRVPLSSSDVVADTVALYAHERTEVPGFDGLVATDDGIFVAQLGTNRVGVWTPDEGLINLAGAFRGSSDVAYDAERGRLYVANWDQRSLLPVDIIFFQIAIDPHLPFAIDVITFEESQAEEGG